MLGRGPSPCEEGKDCVSGVLRIGKGIQVKEEVGAMCVKLQRKRTESLKGVQVAQARLGVMAAAVKT